MVGANLRYVPKVATEAQGTERRLRSRMWRDGRQFLLRGMGGPR